MDIDLTVSVQMVSLEIPMMRKLAARKSFAQRMQIVRVTEFARISSALLL